jgi:FlaA1/EpsC-like NDP-sugar epimerase
LSDSRHGGRHFDAVPKFLFDAASQALLVLVPTQVLVFWLLGLYRGVWRFASVPDLVRILKAVAIGLASCMVLLFVVTRLQGVPRSVPVLYGLLLFLFLSGPRFLYRWVKDYHFYYRPGQRVLIVGAGRAGEMLVRDLLRDSNHTYQAIAFVDDNRRKLGKDIHGIRVVGSWSRIPDLVDELAIDVIMLAVPSLGSRQIRRVVELCEETGRPVRTLPKLPDLVSGSVSLNALREVSIEDLLGRDAVSLDWEGIKNGLAGKTIIVTGAGGSIGSELCRQIARFNPGALILFEHSEFNLYSIELELRTKFPELILHVHLGDVSEKATVDYLMDDYRPQVVFHAAAYKHVPMLEHQVREAVRNNVIGTRNVAQAADRYGVEEFVLISTDKAVNPTNIMGTTKRVAEIFCQNLDAHSSTRFITVRFGNVLGSAGSVVPLFRKQIEAGGPVTVTHPEVTRFFMTIPEACQLIMQASVMGKGGEIFVLDMGESIKISYLAEQMIRLAGKIPGEDIEIIYTGLRPGEKLYEELFHELEPLAGTSHEKILLARYREMDWNKLNQQFEQMENACSSYDGKRLKAMLRGLVPEFQESVAGAAKSNVIPLNNTRG